MGPHPSAACALLACPSPKFGRGAPPTLAMRTISCRVPMGQSMARWLHNSTYRARELRRSATPAEEVLWEHLRDRRLHSVKFRRQHAIGPYYADFCAVAIRLVVEADGAYHVRASRSDRARDEWLHAAGYVVLRLTNAEITGDIIRALARIRVAIAVCVSRDVGERWPLSQTWERGK